MTLIRPGRFLLSSDLRETARHAFTRFDLLFTILTVGFLVGLVSWRCSTWGRTQMRVQAAVRSGQCHANLKQLATAQLLYASDHQERFCPSDRDYLALTFKNSWMGTLVPYYAQTNGVWLCPSTTNNSTGAPVGTADAPWNFADQITRSITPGSYGLNTYLALGRNYKSDKSSSFNVRNVFTRESALLEPSLTPIYADAAYRNCRLEETSAPPRNLFEPKAFDLSPGNIPEALTQIIARHGEIPASAAPRLLTSAVLPGSINVVFGDGHVEAVPLENLWAYYWHKSWDPQKVPQPHPEPE